MGQKSCCLDQKGRATANRQTSVPYPLRRPWREAASRRITDPLGRDAEDTNQWGQRYRRPAWSTHNHVSVQVRAPGAVPRLLDVQYPGRGRDPDQKPDGQHLRPGGNLINNVYFIRRVYSTTRTLNQTPVVRCTKIENSPKGYMNESLCQLRMAVMAMVFD